MLGSVGEKSKFHLMSCSKDCSPIFYFFISDKQCCISKAHRDATLVHRKYKKECREKNKNKKKTL
jgi:hypothetical protein